MEVRSILSHWRTDRPVRIGVLVGQRPGLIARILAAETGEAIPVFILAALMVTVGFGGGAIAFAHKNNEVAAGLGALAVLGFFLAIAVGS